MSTGTQESCEPSQEQAEVVVGHGEDGVDAIASAAFEIVPVRAVLNLAADVADDPAKPCLQKLELAPGEFELVGVGIAADHYGGAWPGE